MFDFVSIFDSIISPLGLIDVEEGERIGEACKKEGHEEREGDFNRK
ncbi:hypothetical protein [Paenibacillus arenilitoris]|uniref:Uncharacterized protein n=1 Tax=Paenibacillus arenilitoris TaxID=2772299 RepID=A0A927H734_9BACL|nr:hypothetical protein [Paenibacillus arenilitoris]MBD2870620.1 hypothetical protein [Paenibacillus arenilitoris]